MLFKYFCLVLSLIMICKCNDLKYFQCCSKETKFFTNFTCLSKQSDEKTLLENDFNSIKIETDIINHLPNCEMKKMLIFDNSFTSNELFKYKEICFDSDGINFIGVYCDDGVLSDKNESKSLMFYRTCCPKNYTYNKKDGTCQPNLKESIIKNELNGIIDLFSTGPPICEKDQILVHSEIEFSKGNLFHDLEKHFKAPYCFNEILHADNKLMIYKCESQNYCNRNLCIKKCCDKGESYINYRCEPNLYDYINPVFYDKKKGMEFNSHEYGMTFDLKCKHGKVPITLDYGSTIDSETGILVLDDGSSTNPEQYCMEKSIYVEDDTKSISEFLLLECQVVNEAGYYIKIVGYSLSIICLIITIIVYLNLPELWNGNVKILIGTMITMLICYCIVTVSLHKWNAGLGCAVIGYIIYYSFLSTFAWINVLNIDFYMKMNINYATNASSNRMLYYIIYTIGFPFVMTMILCILNNNLNYSNIWSPQIGNKACFFDQTLSFSHVVYFIVPITIQIVFNIFIFITLAFNICSGNNSISMKEKISTLNKNQNQGKLHQHNKNMFILLVKLFFVMGGTWVLEIFANIFHTNVLYNNISDAINSLNGVMIFVVFIMNKRCFNKITSCKKTKTYERTTKSYETNNTLL